MPKGVPKNGMRMTKNRQEALLRSGALPETGYNYGMPPKEEILRETDLQIEARISERFEVLETLTDASIQGDCRALIVSGPPGLGKSFTVEAKLEAWDPTASIYTFVKGYVKSTGLFKLLYQHRMKGQVLVFDDADTIFYDDTSLNFLKAVCDSSDRRRVSYLADYTMIDDDSGTIIPRSFEFEGTIIFITNLDFQNLIDRGHKLAPHLAALVSRAHYIDLTLRTRKDYMVRINQVMKMGLLKNAGLNLAQEAEVMDFIHRHESTLRELSLRIVLKVAVLRKSNRPNWEALARATCCRS